MNRAPYEEMFNLKNKTAIVTGGLGILGKKFCAGLAAFGANVVVVDLDEKAAQDFVQELTCVYDGRFRGIGCDVSSPEQVTAMVDRVVADYGEIHILHNNAASKSSDLNSFFAPFEEYSLAQWRRIMAVNLDGMFLTAQAVGRQMVKQGKGGSMIQTASIYGLLGPDQRIYEGSYYLNRKINTPAVYAASKAGVIGLSRYLSTYWGPQNIRVNTLTLGGNESGQNDRFIQNYAARVPLGRMGQPEEMVAALIFLASDASVYVTGQNLIVDGGLSAW